MKNKKLNQFLWRCHFIAGLITLPNVLLLAITGAVYLFNPSVTAKKVKRLQEINPK